MCVVMCVGKIKKNESNVSVTVVALFIAFSKVAVYA